MLIIAVVVIIVLRATHPKCLWLAARHMTANP